MWDQMNIMSGNNNRCRPRRSGNKAVEQAWKNRRAAVFSYQQSTKAEKQSIDSLSLLGGQHHTCTDMCDKEKDTFVPHNGEVIPEIPSNISFPGTEDATQKRWEEIGAFKKSLELSEGRPEYTFYDGPPFATGLPHFGHILAGTIKDTVTRYAHQTGHHVERRFGWDCHGLPVEFEIDQALGITSSDQVAEMGIAKYNAECRSIVTRYCSEWEAIISRLGRWIDFKNDYKTLEPWYMESVWWVFKTIFEKGLVYPGYKVMPYSTACHTPLSNFEANQNYQEVKDPAVIVSFPIVGAEDKAMFVAWTTTPWTLPSNLALCMHPELVYVKLRDSKTDAVYIMAESRIVAMYPQIKKKDYKGDAYTVIDKKKGSEYLGTRYTPLFDYFQGEGERVGAFQMLNDEYVTDDSGTGVVHQAPAFGEDDFRCCVAAGIVRKGEPVVCPVDDNGRFMEAVRDFVGMNVKEADEHICKALKASGRLVDKATLVHSYPFCWRSDTPLIYKAVPSWFVNVEEVKEKLLKNNEQTHWVPAFVQEKRFHNWLSDARDWCVSRNRYWGTPLPIWKNDEGEMVVIGSIAELKEHSGVEVTDLHRESVDDITIPSKKGGAPLKRVTEVFDCWFESGSMPYAQQHYPFENKEKFEGGFPADFIAEGLDQTRGWFYTLMVISTILFDKPAFKNLIVNGLVLAADGKKMSKRLKNYPPPIDVVKEHGADALRLYLINSPVVRAEPLKFKKEGVKGVVRDVFLPWFHAFRFFNQSVQRYEIASGYRFVYSSAAAEASDNVMDTWIMGALQSLVGFVHEEMTAYRLYTVVPRLVSFLQQLTNWYVRLNRNRLKGEDGEEGARGALCCMYEVLLSMARLMAPFTPFFAEYLYQNLRSMHPNSRPGVAEAEKLAEDAVGVAESVHYVMLPEASKLTEAEAAATAQAQARMDAMIQVVELGRVVRERRTLPLKVPVREVVVVCDEQTMAGLQVLETYVKDELNVAALRLVPAASEEGAGWCSLSVTPDNRALGRRLGKAFNKDVKKAVAALTHEQVLALQTSGKVVLAGVEILSSELGVKRTFKGDKAVYEADSSDDGALMVALDTRSDPGLEAQGLARDLVTRVQKLRRDAGLVMSDKVEVFFQDPEAGGGKLTAAVGANMEYIEKRLHMRPSPLAACPSHAVEIIRTDVKEEGQLVVVLVRPCVAFAAEAQLAAKCPGQDGAFVRDLQGLVASLELRTLEAKVAAGERELALFLNGVLVHLTLGTDVFLSSAAKADAQKKC